MRARALVSAAVLAGAVTVGLAPTALAQPRQEGLVNVNVSDNEILNNVGVGVAANVLANVCGVQVPVAVLAEQVVRNDDTFTGTCTAQNDAPFEVSGA